MTCRYPIVVGGLDHKYMRSASAGRDVDGRDRIRRSGGCPDERAVHVKIHLGNGAIAGGGIGKDGDICWRRKESPHTRADDGYRRRCIGGDGNSERSESPLRCYLLQRR